MGFNFDSHSKPLFSHLNFNFERGESYWIKGSPGCGKSTLLRLLVALNLPTFGDVLINGESIKNLSFEEFLPLRMKIGYSFDLGGLISNRTLRDNLLLPLIYHNMMSPDQAKQWVEKLALEFDIAADLALRPSRVSGSTKKAAVVARSMVMSPRVLVLDDPTTALSISRVDKLIQLIDEGRTSGQIDYVFFVSEDLNFARKVGTRTIEICNQNIEQTESVQSGFIFVKKRDEKK